jgi:hypothetical protein
VTITRVGSNPKYAEGWEKAFGKKTKTATKAKKASSAAPAKKKKAAKK